jgi:hypothetical protein
MTRIPTNLRDHAEGYLICDRCGTHSDVFRAKLDAGNSDPAGWEERGEHDPGQMGTLIRHYCPPHASRS